MKRPKWSGLGRITPAERDRVCTCLDGASIYQKCEWVLLYNLKSWTEAKSIMSFSVKSLFGVFALMTSTLNENGNNLLFCPTHCNDIELCPYHYEFHLNRK